MTLNIASRAQLPALARKEETTVMVRLSDIEISLNAGASHVPILLHGARTNVFVYCVGWCAHIMFGTDAPDLD